MSKRIWLAIGVSLVLFWVASEVFAGRGGGGRGGGGGGRGGGARPAGGGARPAGGGARPGGMPAGAARPSGGMPAGGARPGGGTPARGGGNINRTPSFSPPGGGRPGQVGGGGRPAQLPSNRPDLAPGGNRPNVGNRPTQLPAGRPNIGSGPSQRPEAGARPGGGNRVSTLPSTRPDIGGRPGVGGRPGMSNLPALGAGAAIGAGVSRLGDRPGALPGLGEGGLRPGQLPANRTPQERREALHDRLAGEGRPSQLPARDWNQVRNDWQQHRDQVRDDWQQHRDEARDDWQNWSDDHYGRYAGWYAGHAPGYWGRWDYLWDNYPVAAAAGLTWWGANSVGYQLGCSDYYNPYYVESMPVSYAEPILTVLVEPAQEPLAAPPSSTPASAAPPGAPPEALAKFDEARAAFYDGRYPEALKLVDAAVAQMPRDAVLHEFRSLVLFALQRYPEAAAAIHAVLDVGPGWDWKTLSSLYPNVDVYTKQLRALEDARDKYPKAADIRFLLGYHYLTCAQPEAALRSFQRARELQPKDAVAAALVATLSPRDAEPSKPAAAAPPAVPADKLVGAWTASGPRTARYAMDLAKDGTFTWSFSRGSRKEQAKGVYTLEGNVLAMEPDGGGVLLAELTAKGQNSLHFKMIGGAANDPGLEFGRKPSP